VRAGGRGGMTGGPRTAAEDIVAAARRRGGCCAGGPAGALDWSTERRIAGADLDDGTGDRVGRRAQPLVMPPPCVRREGS
jgi:hypothetical protein